MRELLMVNIDRSAGYAVEAAAELYVKGKIFAYPTDTIYGFGGDPFNKNCINSLNMLKQRADNKQYILLAGSVESLLCYIETTEDKEKFIRKIWPNTITAVFNLRPEYKEKFGADTAAFRIPDNAFCQALLKKINGPLLSTSVNRAGAPPMNSASEIYNEFKNEIDAVFYTNNGSSGAASTIIDLSKDGIELIREGKIKFDYLKNMFKS